MSRTTAALIVQMIAAVVFVSVFGLFDCLSDCEGVTELNDLDAIGHVPDQFGILFSESVFAQRNQTRGIGHANFLA